MIQLPSSPTVTKKSSIFVRHVTILDCAVLHPTRGPVGQSWWVDVEWEGELDQNGVVFDFSLAKKAAKKTIDDVFDHRLLVEDHHIFTKRDQLKNADKNQDDNSENKIEPAVEDRIFVRFLQPVSNQVLFAIDTYRDAITVLDAGTLEDVFIYEKLGSLECQIANAIKLNSPINISNVKVRLSSHEDAKAEHFFSYTHSLREHFGNCQRFHGHSNIVEVFKNDVPDRTLSLFARNFLSDRYLVAHDYLLESAHVCFNEFKKSLQLLSEDSNNVPFCSKDFAWIHYKGSQGFVNLIVPHTAPIFLTDESSIENISQYVLTEILGHFPDLESTQVRVVAYEGLGKGSVTRSPA